MADETKKTVVVSLWNDLATNRGQELLDIVDKSPVVAIKSVKVYHYLSVSDASGEAYLSVFNEQAEKVIGCTADELNVLKSQEGDSYQMKLKEATWSPHLFRVSVTPHEYNNEKRQRITIRAVAPIDYATESKYLIEEISKMKISSK